MQIAAVVLARTLAFVESSDLNPNGRVSLPELVKAIADRYKFQTLPKWEEREKEGLVFEFGKIGNKVIRKLTLFDQAIVLETTANTSESQQLIEELLLWGAAKFDLNYTPNSIRRFGYVSAVTFYTDAPVLEPSPALKKVATITGQAVSDMRQEHIQYEGMNIAIGHDPLVLKNGIASFIIARRAETRFSEHKYYSEAPLPTDLHIRVLQQYEQDVIGEAFVQ